MIRWWGGWWWWLDRPVPRGTMAQGGLLHCESWPTLSRHCRTQPTWLWAPWEPDNKWPAGQVKRETEWEYLSGQHNEVHFSWNKGNQQTKGFIYRAVATADKNFIFLNLAKDMQPYKKILKWQTSWDFVSVCLFPFIICICFCVTIVTWEWAPIWEVKHLIWIQQLSEAWYQLKSLMWSL